MNLVDIVKRKIYIYFFLLPLFQKNFPCIYIGYRLDYDLVSVLKEQVTYLHGVAKWHPTKRKPKAQSKELFEQPGASLSGVRFGQSLEGVQQWQTESLG